MACAYRVCSSLATPMHRRGRTIRACALVHAIRTGGKCLHKVKFILRPRIICICLCMKGRYRVHATPVALSKKMAARLEEAQMIDDGEISTSPVQGITKEDVRRYFSEVTCNLRVLGSQLGLEPYELDDLGLQKQSDPRQILVNECFKKEKIVSWQQLVDVLEKPALNQGAIANKIKRKYLRQSSSESTTSSRTSSFRSPSSPMEISSGRTLHVVITNLMLTSMCS